MAAKARRLLSSVWRRQARRAVLAVCLWLPVTAYADPIVSARYAEPTERYAHAVLGDAIEYGALEVVRSSGAVVRHRLPETSVFEDTSPRLVDLDQDGAPEVIAVESSQTEGARLVVYGVDGRIAATPYIGTRFRWLAPVGAADLDGDGAVEIAYVDRPHLAKTLRVWRFENRTLTQVTSFGGVTNHRIGEPDIAGGIRHCGGVPEMLVASANWGELLALRVSGDEITATPLGSDTTRAAFTRALRCDD
ncbi:MAG: FG-GAP repeat domain-containing protein [Roseobacter sp.]